MHKSFIITEEDKRRIIGMHLSATKRQYLSEQTAPTTGCTEGNCDRGQGTFVYEIGRAHV